MIFSSGQHLAATSLVRGLNDTQDTPSQTNQNMDSLGGTSSIQTSQGMIDFLQGVEETEAVCEYKFMCSLLHFLIRHE